MGDPFSPGTRNCLVGTNWSVGSEADWEMHKVLGSTEKEALTA